MNGQRFRLAEGGRIDRLRSLRLTFNGKGYHGYVGDTLASALLANGVVLVGRSFKYHRPRGIMGADVEEPNALVQLGTGPYSEPNVRATQVELFEGLVARSVNCWPSVNFDLAAIGDRFSRILPAGFYYKTFMWPGNFWMKYEYFIRQAAGLGKAPTEADPDRYEKVNVHCEVLVVGGGPAGLAAALAAGRTGARVILADQQSEFGGALLGRHQEIDGAPAQAWVAEAVAELAAMVEVRLLPRSTVTGYYDHNFLTILERVTDHLGSAAPHGAPRHRLWRVRATQVVLATGAIERPLVFAGNDRPGIMLASAAQRYVNRYAVRPGSRAVVFANNDSAYQVALDLVAAGVDIAAIVDVRAHPNGSLVGQVRRQGIEVISGHAVVMTRGRKQVRAVEVMRLDQASEGVGGRRRSIACDLVCMSGGWNPAVHLFSQSGGKLRFDPDLACFLPDAAVQQVRCAGAVDGAWSLAECLRQGFEAGAVAARDSGFGNGETPPPPTASQLFEEPLQPAWQVPSYAGATRGTKHFVDFLNDVTVADIALAVREGYGSAEHTKRYTTLGMGVDQGKTSGINGALILSQMLDNDVASVGTTTFRSPYTPVSIGAMAGRDIGPLVQPVRKMPAHEWHAAAAAVFDHVGLWARSRYYPRDGEDMEAAVRRECLAVRDRVGLIDSSTLGKNEIRGPDSIEFLNWIYTNSWDSLAIGQCRYGMMLGEDGMVFDDGITARLGEHRYMMTTNSGNAPAVLAWLERWLQCELRGLRVYLTPVTTSWAVVTVVGPYARRLLSELDIDIDLSPEAFPFMSVREGHVGGLRTRLLRVSYTGELSYEVFVPASYGLALWQTLMLAGEKYGVTPVGIEAGNVLRTEKGFIGVGHDTDGTVTPVDLGMEWIVSKKKADFIGKRSLSRSDTARPDRPQLVGLLTEDPKEVLPEGAQIVKATGGTPPHPLDGVVTSSFFSPTLDRSIALALLRSGHARDGETVIIPLLDKNVTARVADPKFFDPEGKRLRG